MNDPAAPLTLLIIIVTGICSWQGFRDRCFVDKLIFKPDRILARKEYYRLVTSAFLHGDWQHLIFNMLCLYSFGQHIELGAGRADFLLIYFGSIVGGDLLSLWLHRHHEYSALGASGGVSGIIFASIFLFPGTGVGALFLPGINIPGWLFAILYPVISLYLLRAGRDNIGHDAHLGGAICGLLITAGLFPEIVQYNPRLFSAVLVICGAILAYLIYRPHWR
jgi:membrane associated rhomboid family serine protease